MSKFLHHADNDAKAIAIPCVFSENSGAKNVGKRENQDYHDFFIIPQCFLFLQIQIPSSE